MKNVCSCCGQTIKAAKAIKPAESHVDTLSLSTTDAYAYFKKTAPVSDALFMLEHASLTPALRAELETLIARPPARAEFYRRYRNVQDTWRELSNVRDRAERKVAAFFVATLNLPQAA